MFTFLKNIFRIKINTHDKIKIMSDFYIKRVSTGEHGTFGVFLKDGIPLCVTAEPPWLDNKKNESCIPAGTYKCEKFSGARFKNVWLLNDVPDREYILIHQGNYPVKNADTTGCILVGQYFKQFPNGPGVSNSILTLDKLRAILPDTFELKIINCF